MDRFVGMAVFTKVVEGNSFASAARHFGLSPAMVSKHVQALEERLGARLLNRTTRRVSTTEVGQEYYGRSVRILAEVEEADSAASDLQTMPRGLLKVSAPLSFGTRHVTPIIADYLAVHPQVSVDLSLDDRYVDLLEEGFDLAIRVGRLPDSSLIARRLAATPMVICASPLYLERHGAPQTPRDLAGHNCLAYSFSATRGAWHFLDTERSEEVVDVSGRFSANNGEALRVLALKGEGILLAPAFIVDKDIEASHLIALLPGYTTADIPIHAVYPHSRDLSAKVRTFVDFLATRFTCPTKTDRNLRAGDAESRQTKRRPSTSDRKRPIQRPAVSEAETSSS
jgi:DNA-binding transcriptional LysR family regulator